MLARTDPIRILLLAAFAALAVTSLLGESPTWDEPSHLVQGFRLLKTGDPSFLVEDHPPGVQALAAIPFVLAGRPLAPLSVDDPPSRSVRSSQTGKFLAADDRAAIRLFPWAKGMIVLLGVLLGWLVYDEAHRLYGTGGARLALTLFALDPNLLAHTRLVTTDLGITLGTWLVLITLFRWARAPGFVRAAVLGGALGFALLAKFSSIFIVTVLPLLAALLRVGRRDGNSHSRATLSFAAAYVAALFVVWAVHGFEIGPIRSASLDTPRESTDASASETRPYRIGSFLDTWQVPAPEYVRGLRWTLRHVYERGHRSYLHGKYGMHGWREYFPIAFAIKTPIPTLCLLVIMLVSLVRARPRREELVLLVFVGLYFASAIRGSLNIGYRHILPILPPLFVLTGRILAPELRASMFGLAPKIAAAALAVLLTGLAGGTLRTHPHYLAYFNETIGGPKHAWRWLVDASLDWGQDLPGLAGWLREHDVDTVYLSYYGSVDPALYGIRWLPITLHRPKGGPKPTVDEIPEGTYAISASNLVEVMSLGERELTVFQELEPVATIGHSIFIYKVVAPPTSESDPEP